MEQWVRDALRCPQCKGQLVDAPGRLVCGSCRLSYPFRDGIPALLAGRAVELEESQ
ncbi:MAG: Trm112 family protein [Bifidobacteriaceae bacterium]|nr:Trm112 family protein [Bifidobacteriaceae bacterium]